MSAKNKPKYIEVTVKRAAELKRVTVRTIQRWCDDRKLLSIRAHPTASYRVFIPEKEYDGLKKALALSVDNDIKK